MLDAHTPNLAQPTAIQRADYSPPDWLVSEVALDFDLGAEVTRVTSKLSVTRNGDHARALVLNGDGLTPLAVRVDGADAAWTMDGDDLVVTLTGTAHSVETEVAIAPAANTKLMGLYASGGLLCTQCEAEGSGGSPSSPTGPTSFRAIR
jgi:aminopeptidase N